jgi:predicted RNA polymerase sigma factor
MHLQASRLAARENADGVPITLDEQDRALWDRAAIARGFAWFDRSMEEPEAPPSEYQIQAAIASVHATTVDGAPTDWALIRTLYEQLLALAPSPFVRLNHALAVARVDGPAADDVMRDIARLVPVTPVTLVCAALRTFPAEFVPRAALLERIDDLRDRLTAAGAAVVRTDRTPEETFDVAYRMLRMRRVIARVGGGLLVLPHGRVLIDYYANAIAYFTDQLTFAHLAPYDHDATARHCIPRWRHPRRFVLRGQGWDC